MAKYTAEQLEAIACYHNWGGIDQDDDGHLVWNTSADAETGWRRVTAEQIAEALAAER